MCVCHAIPKIFMFVILFYLGGLCSKLCLLLVSISVLYVSICKKKPEIQEWIDILYTRFYKFVISLFS